MISKILSTGGGVHYTVQLLLTVFLVAAFFLGAVFFLGAAFFLGAVFFLGAAWKSKICTSLWCYVCT